jgi:hypothetical protein
MTTNFILFSSCIQPLNFWGNQHEIPHKAIITSHQTNSVKKVDYFDKCILKFQLFDETYWQNSSKRSKSFKPDHDARDIKAQIVSVVTLLVHYVTSKILTHSFQRFFYLLFQSEYTRIFDSRENRATGSHQHM